MATDIKITAGDIQIQAHLNDSPTARAIIEALPITASANRWGQEIYFTIPVKMDLESDAREVVEPDALGYWPTGSAFCMFWGPTPASQENEIRAASAVNIIGKMTGILAELDSIKSGTEVRIDIT
ncbi:MAG: hypothetical protein JW860_11200 [Sedimentisphaerales bacterium]|nr:hypothetical protein [Sedimentisphaerales bacterium]